jgi:cob(I)alamin adenosyltransferase
MKIDQASQISTKKGDKGTSSNYSSETLSKYDLVFEVLGTVDELSASLGMCYHHSHCENLKLIQQTLQTINSIIATSKEKTPEQYASLKLVDPLDITFLEKETQKYLDLKPLEPRFVLPATDSTFHNAYFDVSRTICRRAERILVRYKDVSLRDDLDHLMQYMNRLSDLLFVMARNFPNPMDKQ